MESNLRLTVKVHAICIHGRQIFTFGRPFFQINNGSDAVIHPEFQKWGSMGPWFSKNGAHIRKCGFDDFCQLLLH